MNQQKIGNFLKQLRKEKGLTQEELAEQFYVSSRSVSRWETGMNMPDIDTLILLSDFYNVDIHEIISGERKNNDMDIESVETLKMVAEYAVTKSKNKSIFTLRNVIISTIITVIVVAFFGKETKGFLYGIVPEDICSIIKWIALIPNIILFATYCILDSKLYAKIKSKKRK